MRAGFSAEGQLTKLSTKQLWLVVSSFLPLKNLLGRSSNANELLPPRPAPDEAICKRFQTTVRASRDVRFGSRADIASRPRLCPLFSSKRTFISAFCTSA